jgi:Fe(3+) dicitrate transport protein
VLAALAWTERASAQDEPPPDPRALMDEGKTGEPPPEPSGVAASDQAPPSQAPREEQTEVRVIGSRADALQKVPGSGTVIGEKDIRRAQPVDTAEMLRRVPGVQVRQEYGGGNRLDISVRGLEGGRSRRVLVLEDGIPLSVNPYSEPDMYYGPAIERYRGIEVVKGSGNILFGPQTLAGTINFLTLAPPESQKGTVDVDVGTYGYVRGLANYGDRFGETRYVVQVLQRHGDGFRDMPFDSTDVLGKIALPTGRDGEVMLKLGWHHDDAASDAVGLTSAMYRADPRRASLSPSSHMVLDRYDVSATHQQRFSSSTKLTTVLYAYRLDRVWRREDYTRSPSSSSQYTRIVGDTTQPGAAIYFLPTNTILDREYDVAGVEPRLEHRVKTGAVAHTLDVGGRVLHETAHYGQRAGSYPETFAGSNEFEEKHTGNAFAAYLQDRIAFRDDLIVTPGVRYEHLAFRRTVLRQFVNGAVADVYNQGEKTVQGIIPGVGMVVGTKQLNVFGGLHVGWAPPRVTSSITARGQTSEVGADESINYELGARAMPAKWARVEATGFLSNFSNQVIANTALGADTELTDAGATNLYGVESATALSLDKALGFDTVCELGARYTYSRATFRYGPNAGNLLPYAPQHTFNTNLDVEHPSGVGGQAAYSFVGPQFTDPANTRDEDVTGRIGELSARHVVDTTLHYKHKASGITVRLTVKNLFDADYVIARRPEGIFQGGYRQVLLGARWDWEGSRRE